ncbi:hypothetical protein AMATHDRAFT_51670 [Amanita thiersii Skay4041]|uniref:Uncharacterized protein n=1 Tax=Amanita thiersii Skay4041 TaxID=703135 RepID=A0A2A9NCB6_9AGAR|nr:hypothetical protein AMATHDRAFT_51670 [Amanita thiersii Skay4041]
MSAGSTQDHSPIISDAIFSGAEANHVLGLPIALLDFPVEIVRKILIELVIDPTLTKRRIAGIRCTCKAFDDILAPAIFSDFRLFMYGVENDTQQLQTWISPNNHLHVVKRITIKRLNSLHIPLFALLSSALQPDNGSALARFPYPVADKLDLSQLSCFRWRIGDESTLVRSQVVQLLSDLPQLAELDLRMQEYLEEFEHLTHDLSKLHTLKRFSIDIYHPMSGGCQLSLPHVDLIHLGQIFRNNPDLTHLSILRECPMKETSCLADLLPEDRLLKLEHLQISSLLIINNLESVLPHIRSLSSIVIWLSGQEDFSFWELLGKEGIFPSSIATDLPGDVFLSYLAQHPNLVRLTIDTTFISIFGTSLKEPFMSVVAQHARTLQYISIDGCMLQSSFRDIENEIHFSKCLNLKEIEVRFYSADDHDVSSPLRPILKVLSKLDRQLKVVIDHETAYFTAISVCREDENELLRDMERRIIWGAKRYTRVYAGLIMHVDE